VSDPQRILVAELHGLAGRQQELSTLLGELALISAWTGEDALRAHYATPHYRRYREQVGPLLARPSDVVVHRITATVRTRDPNPPDPGELG
jgi:hypothetical protein